MNRRDYTPLDQLVMNLDMALQTVFGQPKITERPNPADDLEDTELSEAEQRHVAGLMRINHAGEVCAQALYQGQALTAKLPEVRDSMARAAQEENDHLDWCEGRVKEMGSRKSQLNPLWYAGSFAIGATAGFAGDKWSLGFVAETEKQVVKHLDEHLESIPEHDEKSRAILEQMKVDEQHHATLALQAGGADLPWPIKKLMGLTSKLMTKSVYHI